MPALVIFTTFSDFGPGASVIGPMKMVDMPTPTNVDMPDMKE